MVGEVCISRSMRNLSSRLNRAFCLRWGGSRIIRYTPDGAVDLQVVFPTALNVTACCFGGKFVDPPPV